MDLSQISKAQNKKRNKRKGPQARIKSHVKANPTQSAEELALTFPGKPHAPGPSIMDQAVPHTPPPAPPVHTPPPTPPAPAAHAPAPVPKEPPKLVPTGAKKRMATRNKVLIGAGLAAATGAAAGGGLYAYQRRRVEKSLSYAHRQMAYSMMRSI